MESNGEVAKGRVDDIVTSEIESKNNNIKPEQDKNEVIGLSGPSHTDPVDHEAIELSADKLVGQLSDPGKFSYLGLCSTVLSLLFGTSEEEVYRHKTIYSLVKHVGLESNCYPTMVAISDGMNSSMGSDVFIESLLEEKCIKENPICIAEDLVLWALLSGTSDGTDGNLRGRYDARTRILLRHITWQLHILLEDLESVEREMVKMLEACTEKEKSEQEEDRKRNQRKTRWKRYALIGLAAAGGGAIIGLTGGLAAPLVAAGAGTILGASSAAALGSVAGLAVITSLFGAAGAGLTGYKMKRRIGGIDEFMFRPLTPGKELNVTIAISGWLASSQGESDFARPWTTLRNSQEQYYLVWETEHLIRLGGALEYILESLVSVAASEALKYTVLSGLVAAVAWPASLLGAASVIDNPWSVCLQRATQVGKELAEVLLRRQHGHRPVTLIGYSLGARVIFHCLEEMSKRKNHSGIIEDVILLGAPVTGSPEKWAGFSSVVAGHITNGYCRSDWLLKFLYRGSSRQAQVAGLHPVEWENRRMINIDLTSVLEGHLDYKKNMDTILSAVGLRTNREALDRANNLSIHSKKTKKSQSMPLPDLTKEETASSITHSQTTPVLETSKIDECEDALKVDMITFRSIEPTLAKDLDSDNVSDGLVDIANDYSASSETITSYDNNTVCLVDDVNANMKLNSLNTHSIQPALVSDESNLVVSMDAELTKEKFKSVSDQTVTVDNDANFNMSNGTDCG